VHASLLPKYRGAAPIAWAIYHGEKETGVTIIRMSPFLDAGDMLAQEALPIAAEETAGDLEARLSPLGARLAVQVIDQIAAGTTQGSKQDKTQATKAPKLTKEHGLIDWNRAAEQVHNQIRAMQPWPTPYTFLRQPDHEPERLIIFRASVQDCPQTLAAGALASDASMRLWVGAGAGCLEILELQPASKRRMTPAEYLRGHPLRPGAHFGPQNT
jgi:methionyl-tRNA formyltransferase